MEGAADFMVAEVVEVFTVAEEEGVTTAAAAVTARVAAAEAMAGAATLDIEAGLVDAPMDITDRADTVGRVGTAATDAVVTAGTAPDDTASAG